MTTEEIKNSVNIRDYLSSYGISINRGGFCQCIFHQEKTASMKIYKDSFYCFGCHKSGDIFDLVKKLENTDFKGAFKILGGTNGRMSDRARLQMARMKRQAEKEQAKKRQIFADMIQSATRVYGWRKAVQTYPPLSDEWTIAMNELEFWKGKADYDLEQWARYRRNRT